MRFGAGFLRLVSEGMGPNIQAQTSNFVLPLRLEKGR